MRRLAALAFLLFSGSACTTVPTGVLVSSKAIAIGGSLFIEEVEDGSLLILDGPITLETAFAFLGLSEETEIRSLIVTQSPGGDLRASHRIGREIRDRGINTAVLDRCVSACLDIFIAGRLRGATPDAIFLLHGAANRELGYALDAPYWKEMGFGALNERVYALEENQLISISGEQALAMGLANDRL